ncbi:MAG: alpha-ketoglutarate-dependent dioxygenase AlkB family protein [Leptonema sp. (in: bacteria)]
MKKYICFSEGALHYIPNFIPQKSANKIYGYLYNSLEWQNKKIFLFGKWVEQPRKICWFGDTSYKYSHLVLLPNQWDPIVKKLKTKIEESFGLEFNHALLNLYENENHYLSWHSDNEKELGTNPTIASLSFGVTRKIVFCRKDQKRIQANLFQLDLMHGSLLLMLGSIQHHWVHSIPKERKMKPLWILDNSKNYPTNSRISITFRKIYKIN